MATTAGGGNVGAIDGRLWIACAHDFVRATMAILTVGSGSAGLAWFGMEAVLVGFVGVGVTLNALDLERSCFVRRRLYILVTIHTAEERTMDGMLEFIFIHEEADRFAVVIFCKSVIRVACEAVRVLRLVLGACRIRCGKQRKSERREKKNLS